MWAASRKVFTSTSNATAFSLDRHRREPLSRLHRVVRSAGRFMGGMSFPATHALFRSEVERKLSNLMAHFARMDAAGRGRFGNLISARCAES